MRRPVVAVGVCGALVALLLPAHTLASTAPCPQCVAGPPVVSAKSVVVVAPFGAANPLLGGAAGCLLQYSVLDSKLHSVRMTRSATAFSGSIVGIPPATTVTYRMSCDGAAGPFVSTKTQPTTATPPKLPATIAAKRIEPEKLSFTLDSDSSEQTVFWIEMRTPKGDWDLAPDMVDTFATKGITVAMWSTPVRLGMRNSAGTSYSAVIP